MDLRSTKASTARLVLSVDESIHTLLRRSIQVRAHGQRGPVLAPGLPMPNDRLDGFGP